MVIIRPVKANILKPFHIFLILSLPTSGFCQFEYSYKDATDYLEKELQAELGNFREKNLQAVDQIQKKYQRKTPKKSKVKKKNQTVTVKQNPYRAILKKNALLLSVDNQKTFKVPKSLQVMALEKRGQPDISYLYSKSGKIKYQTARRNLISIQEDYDLSTGVDASIKYNRKSIKHKNDSSFLFENTISFHLEQGRGQLFSNIFSGNEKNAQSKRFEYKSYFRTQLPIHLGMTTSYQTGEWMGHPDQNAVTWRAAYLGPTLLFPFKKSDGFSIDAQLSFQRSLLYKISTDLDQFINLDASVFELQVGPQFETSYGRFSLNFAYRQYRTSITSTNDQITWNPRKGKVKSLAFALGYLFDVRL